MGETKACPYCGEEILAVAIKCKHCQSDLTSAKPAAGTATPAVRPFFKVLAAIVFLPMLAFIVFAIFSGDRSSTSQSVASNAAPVSRSVFQTTATDLYHAYEENEVATDQRIGNALIEVSGVIAAIDKDFTDDVVLRLRTGNEFEQAGMTLVASQRGAAARLTKGQPIVVQCDKMTRIVGSPQGRDCIIVR